MTLGAATGYAQTAPLNLKVYNADAASFHVNSVLVTGKTGGKSVAGNGSSKKIGAKKAKTKGTR